MEPGTSAQMLKEPSWKESNSGGSRAAVCAFLSAKVFHKLLIRVSNTKPEPKLSLICLKDVSEKVRRDGEEKQNCSPPPTVFPSLQLCAAIHFIREIEGL